MPSDKKIRKIYKWMELVKRPARPPKWELRQKEVTGFSQHEINSKIFDLESRLKKHPAIYRLISDSKPKRKVNKPKTIEMVPNEVDSQKASDPLGIKSQ